MGQAERKPSYSFCFVSLCFVSNELIRNSKAHGAVGSIRILKLFSYNDIP